MPATAPKTTSQIQTELLELGQQIRARRKALGVNATVAAEAAGMSRVTLHRIENGEPSVTMGAYMNVLSALGMSLSVADQGAKNADQLGGKHEGWIPVRIRLADYPQLKQLAWQVQGVDALTPVEAFDIYERNARHLDAQTLDVREQNLIQALQAVFGERVHV